MADPMQECDTCGHGLGAHGSDGCFVPDCDCAGFVTASEEG